MFEVVRRQPHIMSQGSSSNPCVRRCYRLSGIFAGSNHSCPGPGQVAVVRDYCVAVECLFQLCRFSTAPSAFQGPLKKLGHADEGQCQLFVLEVRTKWLGKSALLEEKTGHVGIEQHGFAHLACSNSRSRHKATAFSNPSSTSSSGQPPNISSVDLGTATPCPQAKSSKEGDSQKSAGWGSTGATRTAVPFGSGTGWLKMTTPFSM